jgi:hypothetical protein
LWSRLCFFFLDSEFAVCTFLRGFHRWGFCKVYTHGRNIRFPHSIAKMHLDLQHLCRQRIVRTPLPPTLPKETALRKNIKISMGKLPSRRFPHSIAKMHLDLLYLCPGCQKPRCLRPAHLRVPPLPGVHRCLGGIRTTWYLNQWPIRSPSKYWNRQKETALRMNIGIFMGKLPSITGGFILCFSRRKITSNFDSTSCQIGLHTTPASAEFLGVSANSACHRPRSGDGGHSNGRDKQDPKTRYVTGYISSFAKRLHLYAERTAPESGTC